MTRKYPKILRNRKQRIQQRLKPRSWGEQASPMFSGSNIHYEMAVKAQGIGCGGIGAIHLMAQKIGLVDLLNEKVSVLKRHLPYHESDHILNIAYNVMAGGMRLEDIELRRQDESFLNGLGAQRIPDPTTAGDFTRRFRPEDTTNLMECLNQVRQKVWAKQPAGFMNEAIIDVDGTTAATHGECKGGMSLSYKGIWGYSPLIVSLANTKEVLYLVNRPGNVTSHEGATTWIDRAIALVKPVSKKICLRGDTDFSLTSEFDRWDQDADFVFGMDAHPKIVGIAQTQPEAQWRELVREEAEIKTEPRERVESVKEQVVKEKGYLNKKLVSEQVAEFDYQPKKCGKSYRVIALRKNLSVERGEKVLFDEVKYFFYITNRKEMSSMEIVRFANERADQENVIEQMKNGVNAMRMPVDNLESNWAYMVMAALAWNLKAWYGMLMPNREKGTEIVKMEFRRFLHTIILLPAQIIRSGRKIIYRIMSYNSWLKEFFATWECFRQMEST